MSSELVRDGEPPWKNYGMFVARISRLSPLLNTFHIPALVETRCWGIMASKTEVPSTGSTGQTFQIHTAQPASPKSHDPTGEVCKCGGGSELLSRAFMEITPELPLHL